MVHIALCLLHVGQIERDSYSMHLIVQVNAFRAYHTAEAYNAYQRSSNIAGLRNAIVGQIWLLTIVFNAK